MGKDRNAGLRVVRAGRINLREGHALPFPHVQDHFPPRVNHKRMAIGRSTILVQARLSRRDTQQAFSIARARSRTCQCKVYANQ